MKHLCKTVFERQLRKYYRVQNYIWRNRKVAITGLVQVSNLITSYNGNKK